MKRIAFLLAAMAVICSSCLAAAPPNDNFADRIQISGSSGLVPFNNHGATIEPGEPRHMHLQKTYRSVWWKWTAPYTGEFGFQTKMYAVYPYMCFYTGNSITNLVRVSTTGAGYVHLRAEEGTTYNLAVSFLKDTDLSPTLLYYPDPLSYWFITDTDTRYTYKLKASRKGAIAHYPFTYTHTVYTRTNKMGFTAGSKLLKTNSCSGITIIDRKNAVIVSNYFADGAGTNFDLKHFDDKYLYLYNGDSDTLIAYCIKKNRLEKIGFQTIAGLFVCNVKGKCVYAVSSFREDNTTFQTYGLKVFDRNLKKLLWEHPVDRYYYAYMYDNGVYSRHAYGEYNFMISLYKKGKIVYDHPLPYQDTRLNWQADSKGNLVYWYFIDNKPYHTNSLLTLIGRKGKPVQEDFSLPGSGNAWRHGPFSGNILYMGIQAGNATELHAYKLGKKIIPYGTADIEDLYTLYPAGSQLAVLRMITGPPVQIGMLLFDKKLKKTVWTVPMQERALNYIDKGTFVQQWTTTDFGITNVHVRIFDRKRTIAEHVIPR